jgi:short-subunit dehydrogenase
MRKGLSMAIAFSSTLRLPSTALAESGTKLLMTKPMLLLRALLLPALLVATTACTTTPSIDDADGAALRNRTYVLVGASSGFGQGVALKLAAHGANVVLAARRQDLLESVAAEARSAGAAALVVPMDVSDPQDVRKLSDAAVSRFGRVDVWINFAGVAAIGRFWEIPLEDHARLIDVNLKGVIHASHAALRLFRAQGEGTLINLGSIESEVPLAYQASYAASKAGVRALGQAVNQELRLAGLGNVKVVTVEPWAVDTPLWRHAANYSGGTPRMAALDDPQIVVDAVVWVSLHPRSELPVGWKAQAAWFWHHVFPHLTETTAANIAHRYQIETAPPAPPTKGNLFEPMPEGRGIADGVRERIRLEDEERKGRETK